MLGATGQTQGARVPRPDESSGLTNPTIFLRLRAADPAPRQVAWEEFDKRYTPIIRAFVRRFGARDQDVDDVVQDVLMGFYVKSPTFSYDPSKGRFRSYLKTCAYHALRKRLGKQAKLHGQSIDTIEAEHLSVEQEWNDVWERERLRLALEDVRQSMGQTKTFHAFELYVVFDQPADQVAEKLQMHINSVYRAKEQVTKMLQDRLVSAKDED